MAEEQNPQTADQQPASAPEQTPVTPAPTQSDQNQEQPEGQTPEQVPTMPEKKELPKTTQEERNMAGLGYIPLLAFLSITLKPKSEYCQRHGNQGIVITILWFVVIFWLALEQYTGSLAFLATFAINTIALFRAYKGEYWDIPVLSAIAKKINLGKNLKEAMGVEEKKEEEKTSKESPMEQPATQEAPKEEEPKAETTPEVPVEKEGENKE